MSESRAPVDHFQQVADSKNLSQLIRSNTVHYWTAMKHQIDLGGLKPYLGYEGMLAGDPHAGNFAALPLRTLDGPRKMRYVDVDFDDCGRGPFVLDFIRFVIASKANHKEVKRRELEKAYHKGLTGKEIDSPKKVRALLTMRVADYDAMAAEYLRKRSTDKGFIFKSGEIEPYDAKIRCSDIESLFPRDKVIDLGIRPETRGGSAGELRIWVIVENQRLGRRLMELKQYDEPATAKYQPQPAPEQRLKEIRSAFWPRLDGSDYDLIDVRGAGLFWIREKRVALIDLPYSSEDKKQIDFLDKLEIYDANQLGLAHGRQRGARDYRASINTSPEAFHEAIEPVAKAYLAIASKVFASK
jgi:hypothetical protein